MKDEIVLYQPDAEIQLEVRLQDETVWLTQQQMAMLFGVKENNITYHIQGIYKTRELEPEATTQKIRVLRLEGKRKVMRPIDFYNLDMIISVGYRVNSTNATQFRRWATSVLKEYMLRGYAVNQRLLAVENRLDRKLQEHTDQIKELQNKVDFFVRTNIPPVEQVFFEGEFFAARALLEKLIKTVQKRVIVIDAYVDACLCIGVEVTVTISGRHIDAFCHNGHGGSSGVLLKVISRLYSVFFCLESRFLAIGLCQQ